MPVVIYTNPQRLGTIRRGVTSRNERVRLADIHFLIQIIRKVADRLNRERKSKTVKTILSPTSFLLSAGWKFPFE